MYIVLYIIMYIVVYMIKQIFPEFFRMQICIGIKENPAIIEITGFLWSR